MREDAAAFRWHWRTALIAALAVRVAWWWYARPDPVSDFEYLRRLAEGMLDHHQYGYPRLEGGKVPAYPVLLAGLMLISRSVAWLSLCTVVISALLAPAVGRLARALGLSTPVAIGATWICALNPTFVFLSPVLATEHLFALLLVLALTALAGRSGAGEPRMTLARCAITGVLFGLAALTRVDALFYLPVFAGVTWMRMRGARVRGVATFLIVATLVLTPWYLRNRAVIGPGSGLSTAGGPTFYSGHHDGEYGWRPLTGTPLEGLHQLDLQRRAYALGFDYLKRAGPRRIARDVLVATSRQFSPMSSPFALRWSTRLAGPTPDEFSERRLPGLRVFEWTSGLYGLLVIAAVGSLAFFSRIPRQTRFVLLGIVLLNWIGHCWIFLGEPRYRYVAEVGFCLLAAITAAAVRGRDIGHRRMN